MQFADSDSVVEEDVEGGGGGVEEGGEENVHWLKGKKFHAKRAKEAKVAKRKFGLFYLSLVLPIWVFLTIVSIG